MNARRIIGLAGASIWLASVGAIFPIVGLIFVGTSLAWTVVALTVAAVVALVLIDSAVIRDVRRVVVPLPQRTDGDRLMVRRFNWVLAGEIAAFCVVNTVLSIVRRYELMVPADVMIVGIHFLPLAWVFRVPRYYPLGIAFCAAVGVTMALVPSGEHFGAVSAWYVWISVGSGLAAILCAAANTREAQLAVRQLRPSFR